MGFMNGLLGNAEQLDATHVQALLAHHVARA
jgi:hypothetical protein